MSRVGAASPAGPPAHPYRWTVLGAAMTAQAAISSVQLGLPAVAPDLRAELGLSLSATGALLAASSLGIILTLLAWGALADRIGDRAVIAIGLLGAAGALGLAAVADGAGTIGVFLVLAGACGSAANAASGRAVVAWFPASQRGFALGWRHMSTPLGGALGALLLPLAAGAGGVGAVFFALALACVVGALVGAVLIREPGAGVDIATGVPIAARMVSPVRDRAIWRLSLGTGAVVLAQLSILSFLALYLHEQRGWGVGAAAAALAGVQVTGAAARVFAGAWSDRVRSRIGPLRTLALSAAIMLAGAALLLPLPTNAGVVLLIGAGVIAMAGNGISFAAASEMAGPGRVGTALGLQNTVLFCAVVIARPAFGALVAPVGWSGAFALTALCPLVGWLILMPLRAAERRPRPRISTTIKM